MVKKTMDYFTRNWEKILVVVILPIPIALAIIPFIPTHAQRLKRKVVKKWKSGECEGVLACDKCELRDICHEMKN